MLKKDNYEKTLIIKKNISLEIYIRGEWSFAVIEVERIKGKIIHIC